MTIAEAIIAITILAGLVTGCFEVFKTAATRMALARLETQVATDANTLLQQSNITDLLPIGTEAGVTSAGTRWTRTITPMEGARRSPMPYRITVTADAKRDGVAVSKQFATVRLLWSGP